ncbi:uncharacterized protein [Brachionichthys hirsutus]|uniref:uncharacterized protein isoform X2 n=1 Tax=Brachionichthys hirsutus TaxID=412623 RepID=UPI0036050CE1
MMSRLSPRSGGRGSDAGQVAAEQTTTWLDGGQEESRLRPLVGEWDESAAQRGGSSGADSFHPLLAEVTHNETLEPSMTFELPGNSLPDSPEGQEATRGHGAPAASEEPEPDSDGSESGRSLERLRTEEPPSHGTGSSQSRPGDSVPAASPTLRTEVELTALPEAPAGVCSSSLPVCQGILEQSEITLLSLTDDTLRDKETSAEDEDVWGDKSSDEMMDERERGQEREGTGLILLPDETPDEKSESHPVTLLDFEWGPGGDLQEAHRQKRSALLQRSSRRVEEMKAGKAGKAQQSAARRSQPPAACKTKRPETDAKSKGGPLQTGVKQAQPPPPASDSRLQTCTTEQRQLHVSEMHQRTRRLYEQLEEVKRQKSVRSRQEACAANRLRAKEFHRVSRAPAQRPSSGRAGGDDATFLSRLFTEDLAEAPRQAGSALIDCERVLVQRS